MSRQARRLHELPRAESLRRLARVSLGRIVFTQQALPAIRPVNHLVDNRNLIIRTHIGAAIVSAVHDDGVVVAYEADAIDPVSHLGWSVIVQGRAVLIRNPAEIARYQCLLRPWVLNQMDYVVRIHPEIITGFELVNEDGSPSA
ncbi:pyridoxamine 5'-phosphate oxidase family protein [Nonomuraea guangzhouensis]|uniref:Pyridoxamine 5'-phosphate oxidase family protein n=2 Tax=Nonomuraea guangzhouensis TaxID=1291555 RepID=A0ABW4GTN7_9ACTN